MMEWSVSLGNIITVVVLLAGFIGHGLVQAIVIARWMVTIEGKIDAIHPRLDRLERTETTISDAVIRLAENKIEIKLLSDRISDIQAHGSYRLAELVASIKK